jgi:hypothetical protein
MFITVVVMLYRICLVEPRTIPRLSLIQLLSLALCQAGTSEQATATPFHIFFN